MSPTSSDPQPKQIGPYRLDERLGRGGMGEVYRGYDARLDRPVALKRVRPGLGNPEIALRRFQREARAAAGLRHPAIVQVHDWVDGEGDDGEAWLVMELVEGRSLRDILHGGPLDPPRVVALARDLLEGLAVAHEAGLIHRDLKAENVMITAGSSTGRGRGEQAKILDFGLAKQAMPEAGETQLSEEGKIVGTLSALTPEQVLGQPVDQRADLFALGSLLYEMLAGQQAFVGRNAGETLNRICTARPKPLRMARPEISLSLSTFVDRLLEKDPRRRPASADEALDLLDRVSTDSLDGSLASITADDLATAVEVADIESGAPVETSAKTSPRRDLSSSRRVVGYLAVVAVAVAAVVGFLVFRQASALDTIVVVVPETTVDAPVEQDVGLPANVVHSAVLRALIGFRDVVALEVPAAESDLDDPRDLATAMAADEVIESLLYCDGLVCQVELRRLGGEDGQVKAFQTFTVDPSRLLEIDKTVMGHLQEVYEGRTLKSGVADLDVRPVDYEAFVRLRKQFESRADGATAEVVLAELDRLLVRAPRFVDLRIFEAHVALQRFEEEGEQSFLERSQAAIRHAEASAPDDLRVLILAARISRVSGDLDSAEHILDTLLRLDPGNAEHFFQQALIQEERGHTDRALTLGRLAIERQPSTARYLNFVDLLLRHGRTDEARRVLEQSLETRPDHFKALSRLAQLELTSGSPERAAELYTELVERSPEPTELTNLGTAFLLLEQYDEAAISFRKVLDATPTSPFATLNLADVERLRGNDEEALRLYEDVLARVANHPRAERLASLQAQAFGQLSRREEAVEAIQNALAQRPDHPWTAYEAALVYTLIGDRSSALWNARRALAGGVEPRWFSLPWFDTSYEAIIADGDDRTGQ